MKGRHERQARRANREVRANRTGQTNRRGKQRHQGRQVWKGMAVSGRHRANIRLYRGTWRKGPEEELGRTGEQKSLRR